LVLIWGPTNGFLKKMKSKLFVICFFLFLIIQSPGQERKSYAVIFYNTENLFDWTDDPCVNDDEFTPEGERHWTYKRFQQKISNLSKSIIASAGWDQLAIIGLAEVENRFVLEEMLSKTALKNYPLRIIHKESPDPRGIDVAMLYNAELFFPLQYEYCPLLNAEGEVQKTREILYVKGKLKDSEDTLHIFMNHWPSRFSGLLETKELRNQAAALLKQKCDSLLQINEEAVIIILGDFNDQPQDESIRQFLHAESIPEKVQPKKLYNLSTNWGDQGRGSLKYQSQWFVFDQTIVSAPLIEPKAEESVRVSQAEIVNATFLFEPDERYGGERMNRTYYGYEYKGGFSDHLPVKLTLEIP